MNARMRRHRHDRAADQDEVEAAREGGRVAQEEVKQLLAALVFVNPADVNRERLLDVVLLPEPKRLAAPWNLGTDSDNDTWHRLVAGGRVNHCLLFVRVVH